MENRLFRIRNCISRPQSPSKRLLVGEVGSGGLKMNQEIREKTWRVNNRLACMCRICFDEIKNVVGGVG